MSEWVSVKDRYPPECQEVLTFDKISHHTVVMYLVYTKKGEPLFYSNAEYPEEHTRLDEVTHWMPLPNPPEEQDD